MSNQRAWQLKQQANNRCTKCGKRPLVTTSLCQVCRMRTRKPQQSHLGRRTVEQTAAIMADVPGYVRDRIAEHEAGKVRNKGRGSMQCTVCGRGKLRYFERVTPLPDGPCRFTVYECTNAECNVNKTRGVR